MNTVVAFGNPLLDISVTLLNSELLQKHNLNSNDQKQVDRDEIESILTDISSLKQNTSPGGLSQNTLRVMQWLFRKKLSVKYFGSIGNDERGNYLKELLNKDGVDTKYFIKNNYTTGIAIALIKGLDRSLVACLGAAEIVTVSDLKEKECIDCLRTADLIYIEGFFLTNRQEAAEYLLNYCVEYEKIIAFNLAGKYLCETQTKDVETFALKSNIIFGNRVEFDTLSELLNVNFIDLIKKWSNNNKIVVCTNEAQPVVLAYSGKVQEISVPDLDVTEIVDSTGAGDAFVAGFLTGYLLKRAPINCVEIGCYAAQEILKNVGCSLPQHLPNIQL